MDDVYWTGLENLRLELFLPIIKYASADKTVWAVDPQSSHRAKSADKIVQ